MPSFYSKIGFDYNFYVYNKFNKIWKNDEISTAFSPKKNEILTAHIFSK